MKVADEDDGRAERRDAATASSSFAASAVALARGGIPAIAAVIRIGLEKN